MLLPQGPGLPGVLPGPGLLSGDPDVAPAPALSPGAVSAALPGPEAAPAVAGLGGVVRRLAPVVHARIGRRDCSTRKQEMFPSLFCLLIFSLLSITKLV